MGTNPAEGEDTLTLRLLGRPPEVMVGGKAVGPLRSRKGVWLLALLALRHGRPVEREWLALRLWPDAGARDMALSLRQSLWDLRRALGPAAGRLVSPLPATLLLDVAEADVDVLAFDAALARGDAAGLERAVGLYRGPLLEGCEEPWAQSERQARHEAHQRALETLAEQSLAGGDAAGAASWWRRAVAADPEREEATRGLMRALAAAGEVSAALDTYGALRLRLQKDDPRLQPAPETARLYHQLRGATAPPAVSAPAPAVPAPAPVPLPPRPLPRPLTDLIGRSGAVAAVAAALAERRLVTLMGPGGVGKTRLALAVAEAVAEDYADGARLVSLAPLSNGAYVADAVVAALGLHEEAGRPALDALTGALQARSLLLVLDNCEHLRAACADMAHTLLIACPGLRVLATSRRALGLAGERRWPVPPLALPPEGGQGASAPADAACPADSDAVRLFVERARDVAPELAVGPAQAGDLAAICRRLDGLPLALELAAARAGEMPLATLRAGLDDRFRLLSRGCRAAPPQHRTLQGLLDWSWELLSEGERRVLARLSVFAGGWTPSGAAAVAAAGGIGPEEVPALVESLAANSLVGAAPGAPSGEGGSRATLLETVRAYAGRRLRESGEADETQARHAGCFVDLAERAEPHLEGPEQKLWMDRLEAELDNLRAARDWLLAHDVGGTVRLLASLRLFWYMRGHIRDACVPLQTALARADLAGPLRARACHVAGALAGDQGDLAAARAFCGEALSLARQCGDDRLAASVLVNLGWTAHSVEEWEEARRCYEESLTLIRRIGGSEARALGCLGLVAYAQRDFAAARSLMEGGMEWRRREGNLAGVANALNNLALVAHAEGDWATAAARHRESLSIKQGLGYLKGVADSIDGLGSVALARGELVRSAILCGASEALRETLGCPLILADEPGHQRWLAQLRDALGEAAFAEARARGRALSPDQAAEEASAVS